MKKLILLLLFIPLVSFGQTPQLSEPIYNDLDKQIKYIKKFKHLKNIIDHFETREQVFNFFGDINKYKETEYVGINFGDGFYYSPSTSSTTGNLSYNSISNSIDYNASTTSSDAISYSTTYWFYFIFPHTKKEIRVFNSKKRKYEMRTSTNYNEFSNDIEEWITSYDMKNISNSKFRSFIKKYYAKPKKGEYQYKRMSK